MPIYTDKRTLYSITLSDLTEADLYRIIKENKAQQVTLKEIKKEAQRILNLEPPPSQTKARTLISLGGKVECPICHEGFEPRGVSNHLRRKHHITDPKHWLAGHPIKEFQMGAAMPQALLTAGEFKCPVCGATANSNGGPFRSKKSVSYHLHKMHPDKVGMLEPSNAPETVQ